MYYDELPVVVAQVRLGGAGRKSQVLAAALRIHREQRRERLQNRRFPADILTD